MLLSALSEGIGNTPMLAYCTAPARIFLKLEGSNPTGSGKDRAALFMIEDAERRGVLKAGGTIVEPTSGNTGIGLAAIAAARGYRCVLVMPDSMSEERRKLLSVYGAELVLTEGRLGMDGAVARAKELARERNAFLPMQFENPANAEAHYRTTAPEILRDVPAPDAFVAGVGTGGTLTGVARYLKERTNAKIFAVEPAASPVLSGGKAGAHGIPGIGAGFVPALLDRTLIDETIPIGDKEAREAMLRLARTKGVFAGISSGAALAAAEQIASRGSFCAKTIVAVLPDSGDRYLSLL